MQDHGIPVIIDGIPRVHPDLLPQMISFVLRRLNDTNPRDHTKGFMPVSGELSVGFCIVRFPSVTLAEEAIRRLNGSQIDMGHQMILEKIEQSDRYRQAQRQNLVAAERVSTIRVLDIDGPVIPAEIVNSE